MKKIYVDDNGVVVKDIGTGLIEFSRPAVDCWYDEAYLDSGVINITYNGRPSHRYTIGNVLDDQDNPFTENSFRDFAYDFFGVNASGNNPAANLFRNQVDNNDYAFDLLPEHNDKIVNVNHDQDWVVNLPKISDVDSNYTVMLIRKKRDSAKGTIVPFSGEEIDGQTTVPFYGKGSMTIRKIANGDSSGYTWYVFSRQSYEDTPNQGKGNIQEFTNEDQITIVHDLGHIPRGVEVWVEDVDGIFVHSNAQIIHDWEGKNEFVVLLSSAQTGKILY
jgi:hypothetical protein